MRLLMWVRTLRQTGQNQFTKNHVLLKFCYGAACRDKGSWLEVLAIWLRHQVTLWTLDYVGSSSQDIKKNSHSCPCPNYGITNPRPLGFMLPSMKSTLAFLSLRRTLFTCGQIGTPQHEQGAECKLSISSKALSRAGPCHSSADDCQDCG